MSLQDNMSISGSSTIASWLLAVTKAVDSYGVDSKELMANAGISIDNLTSPNERVPVAKMTVFWQLAVEATGDDAIGLKVANYVQPTTLNALGLSLYSSLSLMDAWQRAAQFYKIVSDVLEVTIEEFEQNAALCFSKVAGQDFAPEAIDAFMATAVHLTSAVSSGLLVPQKIELQRPPHNNKQGYSEFFPCPVIYNASCNRLHYKKEQLNVRFDFANETLAKHHDELLAEQLTQLESGALQQKVIQQIYLAMAEGEPNRNTIAAELHMSSRSLQRKLEQHGVTFSELVIEVRKGMATKLLKRQELSITDVASQLGFADPSNFSRAFKKWFGVTPKEFRNQ